VVCIGRIRWSWISPANAYVAGFSQSSNFPVTAGAFQTTIHAISITLSKLNSTGTNLLYSTFLGGSSASYSQGLAVDGSGNAYVTGFTSDLDFPVTKAPSRPSIEPRPPPAIRDLPPPTVLSPRMNPTGSALVYSTYLGGTAGPWVEMASSDWPWTAPAMFMSPDMSCRTISR